MLGRYAPGIRRASSPVQVIGDVSKYNTWLLPRCS